MHRQQHSIETIGPAIEHIWTRFPHQGSHNMRVTLHYEKGLMVSQ